MSIKRSLQHFLQDRRGGITPMFALAILPVVGLTGAAIDYSRANSVRSAMQAAADSAALMLSKDASSLTASQLSSKATAYFNALFNRSEAMGLTVTPVYSTTGGSSLTITASATVNSSFMKLMGYPTLNIGTSSTVKWGNSRLRVALVLDNTGSMAEDGKMSALKTATNALLTQLKNAATNNGDVYVSIIPFVKDVNVDPSNYGASWIDWSDWDKNNGTCKKGNNTTSSTNQTDCLAENGNPSWTPASHSTWNGCVTDRGGSNAPTGQDYDTNANAPSSSQSSKFAAEQYGSCSITWATKRPNGSIPVLASQRPMTRPSWTSPAARYCKAPPRRYSASTRRRRPEAGPRVVCRRMRAWMLVFSSALMIRSNGSSRSPCQ